LTGGGGKTSRGGTSGCRGGGGGVGTNWAGAGFGFGGPVGFLGREGLLDAEKTPFQCGEPIPKSEQGATTQLFRDSLNANKGGDGENRSDDDQDDCEDGEQFHIRGGSLKTDELEHT